MAISSNLETTLRLCQATSRLARSNLLTLGWWVKSVTVLREVPWIVERSISSDFASYSSTKTSTTLNLTFNFSTLLDQIWLRRARPDFL